MINDNEFKHIIAPKLYTCPEHLYTKKQFEEHIKLYHIYVNNVNDNRGQSVGNPYSINGVYLHELFFEQFGSADGAIPFSIQNILNDMGYKDTFQFEEMFVALGTALKNKGWVAFILDELTDEFKLVSMNAHDENLPYNCSILLILDMYEHAYFMDYGVNKVWYIRNFFKCIDWNVVDKRIRKAIY